MECNNKDAEFNHQVEEEDWDRCKTVSEFLETAAYITENQSGTNYVTLSLTSKAFNKIIKACDYALSSGNSTIAPFAKVMCEKLISYKNHICSDVASLVRIFAIRIGNDYIRDGDLLRKYINITEQVATK